MPEEVKPKGKDLFDTIQKWMQEGARIEDLVLLLPSETNKIEWIPTPYGDLQVINDRYAPKGNSYLLNKAKLQPKFYDEPKFDFKFPTYEEWINGKLRGHRATDPDPKDGAD